VSNVSFDELVEMVVELQEAERRRHNTTMMDMAVAAQRKNADATLVNRLTLLEREVARLRRPR
jgi:hypothetical protein